jgi:hypothetical protein
MFARSLFLPFALLSGCSFITGAPAPAPAPEPAAQPQEPVAMRRPDLPPFDAELTDDGPGRGLEPRRVAAYDPSLPGFVVEAPMGTLALRRWSTMPMPDSLVLVLNTSSAGLEHLILSTPAASVAWTVDDGEQVTGSDGATLRASAGTYFGYEPFAGGTRVVLRRPAMELLRQGGRVEWVDAFR